MMNSFDASDLDIELTIKNYRCFSDSKPARIKIRPGYTAFLGINNSGKSTLLKFFYEFRNLFSTLGSKSPSMLANQSNISLLHGLRNLRQVVHFPQEITDREEVFCNVNNRDIFIQLQMKHNSMRLDIIVQREDFSWTCRLYRQNQEISGQELSIRDNHLFWNSSHVVDLASLLKPIELLANMVYIPSFRNAINVGSTNYYNIAIGQGFITQWNDWKSGGLPLGCVW